MTLMKNYLILIGAICLTFHSTNLNHVCNYIFFFSQNSDIARHQSVDTVGHSWYLVWKVHLKKKKKDLNQLFDPNTHLMALHCNSF